MRRRYLSLIAIVVCLTIFVVWIIDPLKVEVFNTMDLFQVEFRIAAGHYGRKVSKFRRAIDKKPRKYADTLSYLIPQVTCPLPVRLGEIGDGGKWVCAPWAILAHAKIAVAYSLGVNNDTSFEQELYEILDKKCKIYSFDKTEQNWEIFSSFNGTFHRWTIAAETNARKSEYTIDDAIRRLGHRRIDFLKIDIEGGEYDLGSSSFFDSSMMTGGAICQIFIELHNHAPGDVDRWVGLLRKLEKAGFLLFYKEQNYYWSLGHEYSFIHEACLTKFGVWPTPFFRLFAD